jgi:DNA-binding XRE family transcriptional regulator
MACEKDTEQMKTDGSPKRDAFNDTTTISEQPGTNMINDTTDTSETSMPAANSENTQSAALSASSDGQKKNRRKEKEANRMPNTLREFRIEQMMSKAELARKAGLSVLTIDRIEKGFGCRMDTKRKILRALGLKLSDRRKLFQEE